MRTAHFLIAGFVVTLAIVAAGCGGGGSSTTTTTTTAAASEWASGFCGAFATWDQSVGDAISKATSSPSTDSVKQAGTDINTATEQLISDLNGLGAPDTQSGQEIKDSVDSLATTLQTQLDAIKKTVDQTSGLTGIPSAVKDITASFSTMSTALSSTASTIEKADVQGELADAIKSSPDCKDLTK